MYQCKECKLLFLEDDFVLGGGICVECNNHNFHNHPKIKDMQQEADKKSESRSQPELELFYNKLQNQNSNYSKTISRLADIVYKLRDNRNDNCKKDGANTPDRIPGLLTDINEGIQLYETNNEILAMLVGRLEGLI